MTGQADFAQIAIEYQPGKRCLETKSLKFYLASYRNERAFNEQVTNRILDDLVRACHPRTMIVKAEFASRGYRVMVTGLGNVADTGLPEGVTAVRADARSLPDIDQAMDQARRLSTVVRGHALNVGSDRDLLPGI